MMHEIAFGYEPHSQLTVFRGRINRHGALGNARAAPKTNHGTFLAMTGQSSGRGVGHAAHARNGLVAGVTVRLPEFAALEYEPIVLVCGTDKRSKAVVQTLCAVGSTQIHLLRRGMEHWNATGLPAEDRIDNALQ